MSKPLVSIIMGSQSDWETMQEATLLLEALNIPYETKVVSAHRTPQRMFEFSQSAEARAFKLLLLGLVAQHICLAWWRRSLRFQ